MESREEPEARESLQPLRYVKRALAEVVGRATAPVVVLEGAHGVGKTALVRNEAAFRDFHYVTLADAEEFARASAQPDEWVRGLPRPVVIDEAHRIDSLLTAVRQVAPKKRGKRPRFVLLTPQRLRYENVPGPKPERFTLFPLTQAELHERPGCIVDDLFEGDIARKFCSLYTRSDLRAMMRIGGFPARALHAPRMVSRRGEDGGLPFRHEARIMREDDIGPQTTIDQLIDKAILRKTLTNPGLYLGVDTAAQACAVDADTFNARLGALRERFVVQRLTMLDRKKSSKHPFAKTRIHAMDTALAVEALHDEGHDITREPAVFSKVLRTLCINQLVPAAQWAKEPTDCRHWRNFDKRMREVDLVLARDDRLVGITVRNSIAARHNTIGALRFLAEDERFARGFIIYMGLFPRRLAENIWAIPVSALWDEAAFFTGASEEEQDELAEVPELANAAEIAG